MSPPIFKLTVNDISYLKTMIASCNNLTETIKLVFEKRSLSVYIYSTNGGLYLEATLTIKKIGKYESIPEETYVILLNSRDVNNFMKNFSGQCQLFSNDGDTLVIKSLAGIKKEATIRCQRDDASSPELDEIHCESCFEILFTDLNEVLTGFKKIQSNKKDAVHVHFYQRPGEAMFKMYQNANREGNCLDQVIELAMQEGQKKKKKQEFIKYGSFTLANMEILCKISGITEYTVSFPSDGSSSLWEASLKERMGMIKINMAGLARNVDEF